MQKNMCLLSGLIFRLARDQDLVLISSAMAFTTALTLVPLLAITFSSVKFFGGLTHFAELFVSNLFEYLAVGTQPAFTQKIMSILNQASGKTVSLTGFLVLAYTSSRLVSQLERGVQKVWGIQKRRKLNHRILVYFVTLFLLPALIAGLIGFASSRVNLSVSLANSKTFILVGIFLICLAINKWIPNVHVEWKSALAGATLTAVTLLVLHQFFYWISRNILQYNKIYGSFASLPIFLVWVLWSWRVFFLGVGVSAFLNNQGKNKSEALANAI